MGILSKHNQWITRVSWCWLFPDQVLICCSSTLCHNSKVCSRYTSHTIRNGKSYLSPCSDKDRLMLCLNTRTKDQSNNCEDLYWQLQPLLKLETNQHHFILYKRPICTIRTLPLPWTQCHWAMIYIVKNLFKKQCAQCKVVTKCRLPAKLAGWERGHHQLNFGWQTLGKGQWTVL